MVIRYTHTVQCTCLIISKPRCILTGLPWQAAAEAEAATLSMVRRTIPDASSTDEANQIIRGNWFKAIDDHHLRFGRSKINDVLDIGCSVGVSTKYLADNYPSANITVSE